MYSYPFIAERRLFIKARFDLEILVHPEGFEPSTFGSVERIATGWSPTKMPCFLELIAVLSRFDHRDISSQNKPFPDPICGYADIRG
jgi:hypothetical protein